MNRHHFSNVSDRLFKSCDTSNRRPLEAKSSSTSALYRRKLVSANGHGDKITGFLAQYFPLHGSPNKKGHFP
jgi:hypothetical protein